MKIGLKNSYFVLHTFFEKKMAEVKCEVGGKEIPFIIGGGWWGESGEGGNVGISKKKFSLSNNKKKVELIHN